MNRALCQRAFLIAVCCVSFFTTLTSSEEGKSIDCSILAIIPKPGADADELYITGTISIHTPENPQEKSFPIVETTFPKGARYIKVLPSSLPEFARNLIPKERKYFYFANPQNQGSCHTILDLREPTPGPERTHGRNNFLYPYLLILDANGKPAQGFKANLYSCYYTPDRKMEYLLMDSAILDETGILRFHYPQTCSPLGDFENEKTTFENGYFLHVRHPETDQEQKLPVPHFKSVMGVYEPTDILYLAMTVPNQKGSPETGFTYLAKVVDSDGQPVSGAWVELHCFYIGEEIFNLPTPQYFYTGNDGMVQITLPQDLVEECTGSKTIPSHAFIYPSVFPPEERKQTLGVARRKLTTGKTETIALPHSRSVIFLFLDENNQPIGSDKLSRAHGLSLIREDSFNPKASNDSQSCITINRSSPGEGMIEVWPVPLPETYYVHIGEEIYGPVRIEEDDRIVTVMLQDSVRLVLKEREEYTGRVIDAITSAPVSGAFVVLAKYDIPFMATNKKENGNRETIWNNVIEDGNLRDIKEFGKAALPSSLLRNVLALGRTDSSGRYKFSCEETFKKYTPSWVLQIGAPGKLGILQSSIQLSNYWTIGDKSIILPDAVLLPSASLKGKILPPYILPDPYLRENVSRSLLLHSFDFRISNLQTPGTWALDPSPLYSSRNPLWRMTSFGAHSPIDKDFTFEIPAETIFSLYSSIPLEPAIRGVVWENLGPVKPGEVLELAPKEAELKRPYIVKVLYADRKPAFGITIRFQGGRPLVTDDGGMVIGWTSGNYDRVQLNNWEKGNEMMKKIKITIPEDANKIPIVEIVLDQNQKEVILGRGFMLW